jgi:arylsulfatase
MDDTHSPTGTMTLHIDDTPVAEGEFRTMLIQYTLCGEGLCIGYDSGDAVASAYEGGRFPYTGGDIRKVVFDIAEGGYADVEKQLAALLARD